ncbi:uncharacterized protein LOC121388978 [Gigantopelta aegis]|uniref:uncharacterized protein LOC121388978 n=1 Tax=Gigantopelta aegis TaxID=1735272 RepID=UPI001B88A3F0|nr:uncharacterized protein LOC121388978 [Gigantopelta aegis]
MSAGHIPVVVGVDVGGTNTDAVVLSLEKNMPQVLSAVKELTTSDVTTGVKRAVHSALVKAHDKGHEIAVVQMNIGTTHFVNAAVQGKDLAKIAVIRLCGTVSHALPPFSDFPRHLKDVICGSVHLVDGGYRFDGREIDPVSNDQIYKVVKEIKDAGISGIVLSGVFSPVRNEQEIFVADLIRNMFPEDPDWDPSITLSHEIGSLGLLERENAAILNECLKPLCKKTILGFHDALTAAGLTCPIFLTQNDGTLINSENVIHHPVHTFASGPTNSMRGAAYLCDVKDAIVIDIGGTTTDVGVLKNKFPREAATNVKIGNVRTNFRMPDVLSIGLGGGSYIVHNKTDDGQLQGVTIGPLSAGFRLMEEAKVFASTSDDSGRKLTTTDIAVAGGLCQLGNPENVKNISKETVEAALNKIIQMIEECIDKVKFTDQNLPVILVGGGSILLNPNKPIKGASKVIRPEHFGVANAIGAGLCQVSGTVESVVSMMDMLDVELMNLKVKEAVDAVTDDPDGKEREIAEQNARKPFFVAARDMALADYIAKATEIAIKAGADPKSIEIIDKVDMTLSYLPGQATRIKIKVVGNMVSFTTTNKDLEAWKPSELTSAGDTKTKTSTISIEKQEYTSTGQKISGKNIDGDAMKHPLEPSIDKKSGEWILSEWDIECIVVGAGIFGCGGGGSPHLGRLRALEAVRNGKKIRIVTPEFLLKNADPDNDLVVAVAFMGAPLIMYEQLVSSVETTGALKCMEDLYQIGQYKDNTILNTQGVEIKTRAGMTFIDDYQQRFKDEGSSRAKRIGQKTIKALMSAEIGGMNALEPFLVGANLDIPVIDADGMGRAFPELQMFIPYMYGVKPYPATLVDHKNRRAVMLESPSAKQLENYFRDTVIEMGCCAAVTFTPMTKSDVMTKCAQHSISRAWRLGNAILKARLEKKSPVDAILATETAIHVLTGKISDVRRETTGGFNVGRVIIEGLEEFAEQKILIEFQNENLIIIPLDKDGKHGKSMACVPDMICIIDADTAEPIPTEEVRYGTRVSVVVIACAPILRTPTALKFIGPQAFRYGEEIQFEPFGDAKPFCPVGPK